MKKKIILIGIVFVGVGIGIFTFTQVNNTTFEEVSADLINEDETIRRIAIENTRAQNTGQTQNTKFETDNADLIEKIWGDSSDMQLKRQDEIPTWDYTITIYTDIDSYEIILGENDAQIGDNHYQIISANLLKQAIEDEEIEWGNID